MTEKIRTILIRQSEVREALNGEVAKDDADDSKLADLRGQAQAIETELREALAEQPGAPNDDDASDGGAAVDAEERERRELREKCGLHEFVHAAVLGKAVDGAADEYAAAMGCPGMVPITMCGPTAEHRHRERETRAVTPAPADADVPHTHAPVVPALFDRSVAPGSGSKCRRSAPGSGATRCCRRRSLAAWSRKTETPRTRPARSRSATRTRAG